MKTETSKKTINCKKTPRPLGRSLRPVRFVDALSTAGLPERWEADGSRLTECAECGREAEVLCLTLVLLGDKGPTFVYDVFFCFCCETFSSLAGARGALGAARRARRGRRRAANFWPSLFATHAADGF